MRSLDLSFLANRPKKSIPTIILLITAAVTVKMLHTYSVVQDETAFVQMQIDRLDPTRQRVKTRSVTAEIRREVDQANQAITQITVPWRQLFSALEASSLRQIALLSITPDQVGGTVEIVGECGDLAAIFEYVRRLNQQPSMSDVFLVDHQINPKDPSSPIRFTITASWRTSASQI